MRPSSLLALAYERAKGRGRRLLRAVWRRSLPTEAEERALARLLAELGIEQATVDLLRAYRDEALLALRPLASASLKGLLQRVIFKIFTDVNNGGAWGEPQAEDAARGRAGTESAA
jgi:hypothetical protein